MSFRIACDLDGTLADMNAALQREATRILGEAVDVGMRTPRAGSAVTRRRPAAAAASAGSAGARMLTDGERTRLWSHVREIDNFWETLPEIETGAVARLAKTAAVQRWEMLFLTKRPDSAGDTVQVQSQRWLQAHGFELPSVYVVSESRGKIASALSLDVVIDDRPDNCVDVTADSSAQPVLVWRDSPERLPPGVRRLRIQVVSSMTEAIEHLTRLQARAASPRGILGRLRHALHHS
jgi:hypothetical protein